MRTPPLTSIFCFLCVAACGDDGGGGGDVDLSPPELRIDELRPAGRQPVTSFEPGTCVETGLDPAETIVLTLGRRNRAGGLANWTFSPYGGCGTTLQCGVALARIFASENPREPVFTRVAAAPSIPIPFDGIDDGTYTFRVELRDQFGAVVADAGAGYFAEATVRVARRCFIDTPPADGGADAAIDGAVDRDAATPDGGDPGADASSPGPDSGGLPDAGADAGADASVDAAVDAPDGSTLADAATGG